MDDLKNFAITSVATPPTPATSGLSLVVAAGTGASLPVAPFNMVVWPASSQPVAANAEIVRVTGRVTDTLTIARAQEGSTARTIVAGDQISANVTRKTLTDLVPTDSVVAAATRIVANLLAASDTQPTFRILGDGTLQWGLGGTTAPDTSLYRAGVNILSTNSNIKADGDIDGRAGQASQLRIGYNALGNPGIYFGNAFDTNLYRSAAGTLKTDGIFQTGSTLYVGLAGTNDGIYFRPTAGANLPNIVALSSAAQGDANSRFIIYGDGSMVWGLGGANAVDTTLYRIAAGQLKTNGLFISSSQIYSQPASTGTGFVYNPGAAGGIAFQVTIQGEANQRFYFDSSGSHKWGPGGATATDITLYRASAGVLKTDTTLAALNFVVQNAAAPSNLAFFSYVTGDTQNRFNITAGGTISWSSGAIAADTNLYRSASQNLKTDTHFRAGLDVYAQDGAAYQVRIGNSSGAASLAFGSAFDTILYRSAAGVLKTDGAVITVGNLDILLATGDANSQIRLQRDGTGKPGLFLGPGGATAIDTNLYRSGAATLKTDSSLQVAQTIYAMTTNANGFTYYPSNAPVGYNAFGIVKQSDSQFRWQVSDSGTIGWGAGGTTAPDTNLYRLNTGTLKTDGIFVSGSQIYAQPAGGGTGFVYNAQAAGVAFQSLIQGEANNRFNMDGSGTMTWGTGAAAVDTNLYRSAADTLKTDDSFIVGGNLTTQYSLYVDKAGASAQIIFGSAGDINLYRSAAGVLRTDGRIAASDGSVVFHANPSVGTGYALFSQVQGEAQPRFVIQTGGVISWGPGGATAVDVSLYRSAAGVLLTDGSLISNGGFFNQGASPTGFVYAPNTAVGNSFRSLVFGAANDLFRIDVNGKHQWGPGGATALDTTLYRDSAGVLKTGGQLQAMNLIYAHFGQTQQVVIGGVIGGGGILFGSAGDTNLYRSAANQLKTDGSLFLNPPSGWPAGSTSLVINVTGMAGWPGGGRTVEVGPVDSGGTGYRVLRVLN